MVREKVLLTEKKRLDTLLRAFICIFLLSSLFCRQAIAQQQDDAFEDNDDYMTAYYISSQEYKDLECKCLDDDWYRVTIPDKGGLYTVNLKVKIEFNNNKGDLDLKLYSGDPAIVPEDLNYLDASGVTADIEVVSASVPPGEYLIKVFGYDGAKNDSYTMNIETLYSCQEIPYKWIDINENEFSLGDNDSINVPIGFAFNFYGKTYHDINISSNGYLTFSDKAERTNTCFPYPYLAKHNNTPANSILPYWMDLRPDLGGSIFYKTEQSFIDGNRFIVEWRDIYIDWPSGGITFQAILFEGTNQIKFQYKDVIFSSETDNYSLGKCATIGIVNGLKESSNISRVATQYLTYDVDNLIIPSEELNNKQAIMFNQSMYKDLSIIYQNPYNNAIDIDIYQQIEIIFSQCIDQNSIEGAFTIEPALDGAWGVDPVQQNRIIFTHSGFFEDQNYTVIIDPGELKDVFGNTLSGDTDYTITFTTRPLSGDALISISPTFLAFDEVDFNTSSTLSLNVFNDGNGTLYISQIQIQNDQFSCYPEILNIAPGTSASILVKFTPKTVGSIFGILTIVSNAKNFPNLNVQVYGEGKGTLISVSPLSLHFGEVIILNSVTKELEISNQGNTPLNIENITSSESQFISNATTLNINPGETKTLDVIFSPIIRGAVSAGLVIYSNDPYSPTIISLEGVCLGPVISIQPPKIDFEEVVIGSYLTKEITLTNNGDAVLEISSINNSEEQFDANVSSLSIGIGESKTFSVTFTPDSDETIIDKLVIVSNDQNSPAHIPLSGNVVPGVDPDILISTRDLDFGNVFIGSFSILEIDISNKGINPLRVDIIDPTDNQFLVSAQNLELNSGDKQTIYITFMPVTEGPKHNKLIINSNDPDTDESSIEVHLTGFGIGDGAWTKFWPDFDCPCSPAISALALDNSGNLWIGCETYHNGTTSIEGGVCVLNIYSGDCNCYDQNDGLAGNNIIDIAIGPNGEVWIASSTIGDEPACVSRYIGNGKFEKHDNTDMGFFITPWVRDIEVDNNGNPWVATFFSGIFYFDTSNEIWNNYSSSSLNLFSVEHFLLPDDITSIFADPTGLIWIGTLEEGIFVKSPNPQKSFVIEEEFAGEVIEDMVMDKDGNLWISSYKGLMYLPPPYQPPMLLPEDLPNNLLDPLNIIQDLFIDPLTGKLLVASDLGFYVFDGNIWAEFETGNSNPPVNSFINSAIIDPIGDFWVGTTREGLFYFNAKQPEFLTISVNLDSNGKLSLNTSVIVNFSEPMDKTAAKDAFQMKDNKDNLVEGTFSWDPLSKVMTFEPELPLKNDTQYEIRIFNYAKDRAGRFLYMEGDFLSFEYITSPADKGTTTTPAKPAPFYPFVGWNYSLSNLYTPFFSPGSIRYNYTQTTSTAYPQGIYALPTYYPNFAPLTSALLNYQYNQADKYLSNIMVPYSTSYTYNNLGKGASSVAPFGSLNVYNSSSVSGLFNKSGIDLYMTLNRFPSASYTTRTLPYAY